MSQSILIPTDGSDDAMKGVDEGIGLAAGLDATVHGLYVVEEGSNPWVDRAMETQDEAAQAHAEEVLDEVRTRAENVGVEFVSEVRFGPKIYKEINEYVEEVDIDVIAMGSGYHGEIGGLLGSTTDKVLRTSRVPVLVRRLDPR